MDQPLTQEELLVGKPNSRVFTLDQNDSRNPVGWTLQFFSTYDPIRVGGALPVMLYKGVWHQISKEFTLANAAPTIHNYDEQSSTSKEKGKSLTNTEDDIDELLQKAIDQSIRESLLAPNAILPPRKGLLLDTPKMSMTTAPTETVGFTVATPSKEERVKKAAWRRRRTAWRRRRIARRRRRIARRRRRTARRSGPCHRRSWATSRTKSRC